MSVFKCLKCCQLFRVFHERALFVRGGDESIFFSEPVETEGGTSVLSRRAGLSGIPWRILSLVRKTLHSHLAGFKSQRKLPFMKRAKAPQILGEATRA
jgi:hypothetical protein